MIHLRSPRSPSKVTARGEPVDAQARDGEACDRRADAELVAPLRDEPRVFEWLEGATGVRVDVAVVDRLVTLTVDGVLDCASLGVVEAAVLQMIERSPFRVELDLREAVCFGDETVALGVRLQARARAKQVPFLLSTRRRVG